MVKFLVTEFINFSLKSKLPLYRVYRVLSWSISFRTTLTCHIKASILQYVSLDRETIVVQCARRNYGAKVPDERAICGIKRLTLNRWSLVGTVDILVVLFHFLWRAATRPHSPPKVGWGFFCLRSANPYT